MEVKHYIEQLCKVTAEYLIFTETSLAVLMCDDLLSLFFSVKFNFYIFFFSLLKGLFNIVNLQILSLNIPIDVF